jgi:hypothetical protein
MAPSDLPSGLPYISQTYPTADDMNLPQVEFTSPAEWNLDLHEDNRTTEEMIRQFPAVPHDAVNEFFDLKWNVNLEYVRGVKAAETSNEVDNDDESIDTEMPGLQPRQHEDTSCDDDSVCDMKPTKISMSMQWNVSIDDSDGEKFTCQRVRKQRAKRNAKRLLNRRKKPALKKELIRNTPFAEAADDPFVSFIDPVTDNETNNKEYQFFPTNPHPFCTGTIIEENGFLFKEREMDGLIFYNSLQVLDDPNKTLDIINESDQYWTTCPSVPPIAPSIAHLMDSGCTPGTIGFDDTTSDTDYLNDLLVFRPTNMNPGMTGY